MSFDPDAWILRSFEKTSHVIQRLTGITCFGLSRMFNALWWGFACAIFLLAQPLPFFVLLVTLTFAKLSTVIWLVEQNTPPFRNPLEIDGIAPRMW
ncbi:MAG: hypothetical protein V4481_03555, partial [Patescibacteria group bacterium]